MASFTPLESTSDFVNPTVLSRSGRGGAGGRPVGIVIDKACRVYITHIPVERIERDGANALRAELAGFGPVESYKMFTEKSGRFIGSALCTYRNPADAAAAIAALNGQTVDSSTLRVEVARDHGVMLLHQERSRDAASGVGGGARHGFLPLRLAEELSVTNGADGGRWHHDRYQLIAEGKDMDEVLGIRRRGAGRGGRGSRRGYGSRGDRIDAAFEKYISERDALLAKDAEHAACAVPHQEHQQQDEQPVASAEAGTLQQRREAAPAVTAEEETVEVPIAREIPQPPMAL